MALRNSLDFAAKNRRIGRKMPQETSLRKPGPSSIDEAMIRTLVHAFYGRVRDDAEIGPIFDRVIGNDWDGHLSKMCDFWSSVMLMSGRYKASPMTAHMRLKMVRPEHFARWLALFRASARDLFHPEIAELFVVRAENIARSLQLALSFKVRPATPQGNCNA
jgi:hemoglobin